MRERPPWIGIGQESYQLTSVDRPRRALASALISFASDLGAQVVAEGIETEAEVDALRGLGVSYGHGYYLARPGPIPPDGFDALLPHPATTEPQSAIGSSHAPPGTRR